MNTETGKDNRSRFWLKGVPRQSLVALS